MPTVVVIDDDKMDRYLIVQSILNFDKAANVVEVSDGREALGVCGDCGPDVVLLDLSMPEMDGFAVLAELRAQLGEQLQIYILSGSTKLQDRLNARRLHADGYLIKPASLSEYRALAVKIFNALRRKGGFLSNLERLWDCRFEASGGQKNQGVNASPIGGRILGQVCL